jgi:hypothetical protein
MEWTKTDCYTMPGGNAACAASYAAHDQPHNPSTCHHTLSQSVAVQEGFLSLILSATLIQCARTITTFTVNNKTQYNAANRLWQCEICCCRRFCVGTTLVALTLRGAAQDKLSSCSTSTLHLTSDSYTARWEVRWHLTQPGD